MGGVLVVRGGGGGKGEIKEEREILPEPTGFQSKFHRPLSDRYVYDRNEQVGSCVSPVIV